MSDEFNFISTGVGGQGVVLMTNVVGEAGAISDRQVISGEMHGLSQRSGSVIIHLRIGKDAISPLIPFGEADVILALEPMEALRYLFYLRPGGTVITNTNIVHPPNESSELVAKKKERFVTYEEVIAAIKSTGAKIVEIDALALAHDAGNALTENVVMVGALSALSGFPIEKETMLEAVRNTVPKKVIAINEKAFENGYHAHENFDKEE
jgi:indolepyruvate ferredoxin oxidoreductase, beta subunit